MHSKTYLFAEWGVTALQASHGSEELRDMAKCLVQDWKQLHRKRRAQGAYFEGRAEKVTRECNMGNIAEC